MRSVWKNNGALSHHRRVKLELTKVLFRNSRIQPVFSAATEHATPSRAASPVPSSLLESNSRVGRVDSTSNNILLNWRLKQKENSGTVKFEGQTSWSSPNDLISRNSFAKNHVHLWTLLEACINSGNMPRAESVLIGFSEIATSIDVTLGVNNYLNKLVQLNPEDSSVGMMWITKIRKKISKFEPNTVTDAIILKSIYSSGDHDKLRDFVVSRRGTLNEILGHVEVLGLAALSDIVKVRRNSEHSEEQRVWAEPSRRRQKD